MEQNLTIPEMKKKCLEYVDQIGNESDALVIYFKCNSIRKLLTKIQEGDSSWDPFAIARDREIDKRISSWGKKFQHPTMKRLVLKRSAEV